MLVNDNYKQLDTVPVDNGHLVSNPEYQRQGQFYTMQQDATAGEINNQQEQELQKPDVPGKNLQKGSLQRDTPDAIPLGPNHFRKEAVRAMDTDADASVRQVDFAVDSKEARRAARMNQPGPEIDTSTVEYNELQQQLDNPDRVYGI